AGRTPLRPVGRSCGNALSVELVYPSNREQIPAQGEGVKTMKCKITRNAAKVLLKEMESEEDKELKLRVYVTHAHGDHAHYGLGLDKPGEGDVVVETDKGIDVVMK